MNRGQNDDGRQMANVGYRATYEKPSGEPMEIDVVVIDLLASGNDTLKISAFVAGDEVALYRNHGLVPEASP